MQIKARLLNREREARQENKSVLRLPVFMYKKCTGRETHYESGAGSPAEIAEGWEAKPKQMKSKFEEK